MEEKGVNTVVFANQLSSINIQADQIVHNYQFKNYCIEHLIIHRKLWAQLNVRFYACLLKLVVYDVTFFNGKMKKHSSVPGHERVIGRMNIYEAK